MGQASSRAGKVEVMGCNPVARRKVEFVSWHGDESQRPKGLFRPGRAACEGPAAVRGPPGLSSQERTHHLG